MLSNNEKWEEINETSDKTETSLRYRQRKAIMEVIKEVLNRCSYMSYKGLYLK